MVFSSRIIKNFSHNLRNNSIFDIIKSIFLWSNIILSGIFISSLVLFSFPFVYLLDKKRHFLHTLANLWGKIIQTLNPWWTFKIIGKENLAKKNEAVIYVANHQSQADIIALFMISTRFRWLSKASLFKIPLFGWAMAAVGYVPVHRGNKKSAERCMLISSQHLKNGIPMIFFPEGTRSKTGELGAFKNGAFRLAVSLGVPIIPITIEGCKELLPKGSLIPRSAKVTVNIHKAIDSKNLSSDELMLKARTTIAEQLQKDKLGKNSND